MFDYFVIFAAMRTGSNFLEENINDFPGLHCWGEAFNPRFIGHAGKQELLGETMESREADPARLLAAMQQATDGLAGFRFFPGHDPRIMAMALENPRCAKIILTRNPLDSHVSHKIAVSTGQWRLGDMKQAKTAQITFDAGEFWASLDALQGFHQQVRHALQISGQTAFHIGYDDINDLGVLNGLARFLGVSTPKTRTNTRTKVQNPAHLREKVSNYDEMVAALGQMDLFGLDRIPNHEPRRGPAVPRYVAAAKSALIHMPIKGGPEDVVDEWLAALDGVSPDALIRDFTQKSLRHWLRQSQNHRSFTVIRHPLARLHHVFCRYILATGPESYADIRQTLRASYRLPIPRDMRNYDLATHRTAFLAFAAFIKGNLAGQTSVRVDGAWASQTEVLAGMAGFMLPDMIIREGDMARDLAHLAGRAIAPAVATPDQPFSLADIYDASVEAAARAAYQRDYMMFGFGDWRAE
ncbi:MAG: nodulation protein NodH [Paracoccaceae bacterium]